MKLDALQVALGHRFNRPELLVQALTHRSFGSPHNERLEFLGDSVLNCVTAIALYDRFAALREGDLSRLRANLVRQEALFRVAETLRLGECLKLGEGELKSGGHRRPSILADALEAVFAAVFLDAGFEAAKAVIDRLYADALVAIDPASAQEPPTEEVGLVFHTITWTYEDGGVTPDGNVPESCGDGVCSRDAGENVSTCPGDCPILCGDGVCSTGENAAFCPADCPVVCGDGVCSPGETCSGCPSDCGICAGECTPGDVQVCCPYGNCCEDGQRTCTADHTWGPCIGAVPARPICY